MGYFDWYTQKNGLFQSIKFFFGSYLLGTCWLDSWKNVGSAFGYFFVKLFVLHRLGLQDYFKLKY